MTRYIDCVWAKGHEPTRGTDHAAGFDLLALLAGPVTLQPWDSMVIPTGLRVEIPIGMVGLVCPRSGLAAKTGVTVLNAPGVIDPDYRGDVGVILVNHGPEPVTINPGDRVAQMIITEAPYVSLREVATLDDTRRGTDGFGSTGR